MNDSEVVILGLWSPTSQMGGRVIWTGGYPRPSWQGLTDMVSDAF